MDIIIYIKDDRGSFIMQKMYNIYTMKNDPMFDQINHSNAMTLTFNNLSEKPGVNYGPF